MPARSALWTSIATALAWQTHAATITVNNPGGAHTASPDGICTLHDAVEVFNTGTPDVDCPAIGVPGSDTVDFDTTAMGTSTVPLTSSVLVNADITIEGGANSIVIHAPDAERAFVVGDYTVAMNSFTLTHPMPINSTGGGINNAGTLTLSDVTISNLGISDAPGGYQDLVTNSGGGIFNQNAYVTLIRTTISGNTAENSGGGIYSYGGSLDLQSSTVTLNFAQKTTIANPPNEQGGGGGILMLTGELRLSNSYVNNNTATEEGGGVHLRNASLTVESLSTINSNVSSDEDGGGLYITGGSGVTITESTIDGNNAREEGGGLYVTGLTCQVTSSTISNNSADDGGGIYAGGSTLTVTNSTISGNDAIDLDDSPDYYGYGGGIASIYSTLTLTGSTLTMNRAGYGAGTYYGYGGGLFSIGGTLDISGNSVLTGNTATSNGGAFQRVVPPVVRKSARWNLQSPKGPMAPTATISNSYMASNEAYYFGGGAYLYGGSTNISNSTFYANTAYSFGGAIDAYAAYVSVSSSTMTYNQVYAAPGYGGAISFGPFGLPMMKSGGEKSATQRKSRLRQSRQSGTHSHWSQGQANGGNASLAKGTPIALSVSNSYVASNAAYIGGGIAALGTDAHASVDSTTIVANYAVYGGGVAPGADTTVTLTNSTVAGNDAAATGGGVASADGSILNATNSTFSGNTGAYGGGIGTFTDGVANLTNATLFGNSAAAADQGGGLHQQTTGAPNFNLINTVIGSSTNGDCDSRVTIGTDTTNHIVEACGGRAADGMALLDPTLQDNGGLTDTHGILVGSPLRDAGTNAPTCPMTDQRGEMRPTDGNDPADGMADCDIGAVEVGDGMAVPVTLESFEVE